MKKVSIVIGIEIIKTGNYDKIYPQGGIVKGNLEELGLWRQ